MAITVSLPSTSQVAQTLQQRGHCAGLPTLPPDPPSALTLELGLSALLEEGQDFVMQCLGYSDDRKVPGIRAVSRTSYTASEDRSERLVGPWSGSEPARK